MKKKGWSRKELAMEAGLVHFQTVYFLEIGEIDNTFFNPPRMRKIAAALEVSLDHLMTGNEKPEETLTETIGQRVQRLRKAKGWGLDRLKDEAGLNGIAVGIMVGIENGSWGIPKPVHLHGLADALDVTAEYLLDGKED